MYSSCRQSEVCVSELVCMCGGALSVLCLPCSDSACSLQEGVSPFKAVFHTSAHRSPYRPNRRVPLPVNISMHGPSRQAKVLLRLSTCRRSLIHSLVRAVVTMCAVPREQQYCGLLWTHNTVNLVGLRGQQSPMLMHCMILCCQNCRILYHLRLLPLWTGGLIQNNVSFLLASLP